MWRFGIDRRTRTWEPVGSSRVASVLCGLSLLVMLGGCSSDSSSPEGVGGAAGMVANAGTNSGGTAGMGSGGAAGDAAGSGGSDAGSGGQAAGGGGASGTAGNAGGGQGGELPVREGPMVLTSPTFENEGMLDPDYLCQGNNTSPPLDWTPGPEGTLSYAATMVHLPERSFHWALWDIPATLFSLPEDIEKVANPPYPEGSKQHKADLDGFTFYGHIGGCPGGPNAGPGSSGRYEYEVMALDVATLPGVTTESSSPEIIDALAAHKLEGAVIVGVGTSDSFQ